jgi:hypothetical protein
MPDCAAPVRHPAQGAARWPLWRTDGGQWFPNRAEAAAAALLEPTHRYGPAPVPAELRGLIDWFNAWPARGHPIELSANLAGVPPMERNYRELLARGWPHAIPGYEAR